MSMEFDLNYDPGTYSAQNVLGMFTTRQAIFGAVAIAASIAVTALLYQFGLDPVVVGSVCAGVCVPIGYFGLSSRHGLAAEEWVPLERVERQSPQELHWCQPRPVLRGQQDELSMRDKVLRVGDEREEARERKELARERQAAAASDMEADSLMDRYLAPQDASYVAEGGADGGLGPDEDARPARAAWPDAGLFTMPDVSLDDDTAAMAVGAVGYDPARVMPHH